MLDGELAVPCNPKSAYAGSNVLHESSLSGRLPVTFWRRDGTHVTDACEPRQVRKEAAVSKAVCVVMSSIPLLQGAEAVSARLE